MSLLHRRHRDSLSGDEDVDLTPLIDCVFLLLIFFMVTTVFLHAKGLDVDLPAQSEATEQEKNRKEMADKIGFQAYGVSNDMPDPVAEAIGALLDHLHAVDGKLDRVCDSYYAVQKHLRPKKKPLYARGLSCHWWRCYRRHPLIINRNIASHRTELGDGIGRHKQRTLPLCPPPDALRTSQRGRN